MQRAYAQQIQAAKDAQNAPITEADKASALINAGKMGDTGVKAGLVVVGGEFAVAGAIVAAPAIIAAAAPTVTAVSTTVTNVSISAYITTTSAAATVSTVIVNGARTAGTIVNNAYVTAVTSQTFANAVSVAKGLTSTNTAPPQNWWGIGGRMARIAYECGKRIVQ